MFQPPASPDSQCFYRQILRRCCGPRSAYYRQVETVFSEPKASSLSAVELVKALAVQKGANALINLETRQLPGGKWVASGDAVVVKLYGRREQKQS